jgi:hypothetical protein
MGAVQTKLGTTHKNLQPKFYKWKRKKKSQVEFVIFHSAQFDVKQISLQGSVSEQRLLCNCVNVTDKELVIIIL